MMKIILNNFGDTTTFKQALAELVEGAHSISAAVSYMQVGGWELLKRNLTGLHFPSVRIVCTDQMGITQPAAVKRAMDSGVQIRNFTGSATYHPKVYLAYDQDSHPIRFLLGSSNLSVSAFSTSYEAGMLSEAPDSLRTLSQWFDSLYNNNSNEFDANTLEEMERRWRRAATRRVRTRTQERSEQNTDSTQPTPIVDDLDVIEDVIATLQLPIGLLNFDHAGNNIRRMGKAREVITSFSSASDKQRSELNLLGFMDGTQLTALGRASSEQATDLDVARLWCAWLKDTNDAELGDINPKLPVAKRVFSQFWNLRDEVRNYFLENAVQPTDRNTMQTIELLCNAGDVVQNLSLDDFKTLSQLLRSDQVPDYLAIEIKGYYENKGTRGWRYDDRYTLPTAWNES